MQQFIEFAKQINSDTNGDGLIDVYGFGLSNSLFRWPVLAMKYGYLLKSDHNETDKNKLIEVLTFLHDLLYRDKVCPIMEVFNWPALEELFEEGRLGMVLTTTLSTNMKTENFPVTVIPMPEGPDSISGSLSIANGMVVPRISDNQDLGKLFIHMALSEEFQQRMAMEAGFLSIYNTINEQVWTKQQLTSMGIGPEHKTHSYFMNELLQSPHNHFLMSSEMARFWSGFESPADLADRICKK